MTAAPEPLVTFGDVERVNAGRSITVSLDELRARRVNDGRHLWVVGLVYAVDDPETALDDMYLGARNLIGSQPITCMWCVRRYVSRAMPGPTCDGRKEV